jgi:hypothetical protein
LPEFFAEIALIAQIRIASKTVGFCWLLLQIALHCDACDPAMVLPLWRHCPVFRPKSTRQALSG